MRHVVSSRFFTFFHDASGHKGLAQALHASWQCFTHFTSETLLQPKQRWRMGAFMKTSVHNFQQKLQWPRRTGSWKRFSGTWATLSQYSETNASNAESLCIRTDCRLRLQDIWINHNWSCSVTLWKLPKSPICFPLAEYKTNMPCCLLFNKKYIFASSTLHWISSGGWMDGWMEMYLLERQKFIHYLEDFPWAMWKPSTLALNPVHLVDHSRTDFVRLGLLTGKAHSADYSPEIPL